MGQEKQQEPLLFSGRPFHMTPTKDFNDNMARWVRELELDPPKIIEAMIALASKIYNEIIAGKAVFTRTDLLSGEETPIGIEPTDEKSNESSPDSPILISRRDNIIPFVEKAKP